MTQPEETSRPSSYRHFAQRTLLPAPRRHLFSTSDLNWTMIQESPTRQSCGCDDNVLIVGALIELSAEWQPPPPWHHQDSEPSSQLSEGSGSTRPTLESYRRTITDTTRIVQLPATAAIEYVAAGHFFDGGLLSGGLLPGGLLPGGLFSRGSFAWGHFWPGGLLAGGAFVRGTFVRGAYARSPQVQCVYAPSRLSVRSIVVWRTNKQTDKKQTKNDKLGPVAPQGVDPRSPNFQGM